MFRGVGAGNEQQRESGNCCGFHDCKYGRIKRPPSNAECPQWVESRHSPSGKINAVLQPGSYAWVAAVPTPAAWSSPLIILSPSRRPRRSAEWDAGKAIIFFVTLGATRSVTLAARAQG
jgi:hypothetical protein